MSRICKTQENAIKLLDYLEARILGGDTSMIRGYSVVKDAVGWSAANRTERAGGHVTSMLDYACFVSGLPMLCSHFIRNASGDYPETAWSGFWRKYRDEIRSVAAEYEWTQADFDKIRKALAERLGDSDVAVWANAAARGEKFVEFNLHLDLRRRGIDTPCYN